MWPFSRSTPTCPTEPDRQQWIDGRFRWLQEQLGQDVPRKARVILPTAEFFPDPYAGTHEDVQAMLIRVAGYMNVDPKRFELFFYSESDPPPIGDTGLQITSKTDGLYMRDAASHAAAIGIETEQVTDPLALVATLAHEIGHDILLGGGRISADEDDHEPLTDLLTVFLGLGVFTANATIKDRSWSQGTWAGWHTSRHGYLDQRTLGYALARFAHVRREHNPPWIKHVRPDVRTPLKQALRFLGGNARL